MAARPGPRVRRATLRRLVGVDGVDDVARVIPAEVFEGVEHGPSAGERVDLAGVPAVWFWTQSRDQTPDWLGDVGTILGHDLDVHGRECGVLLALEVNGSVYTVTYGSGWRMIGDQHLDRTFGLRVVVRCLDATAVRSLVSHRYGEGRTDATHVAGGAPIWALRPTAFVDVVKRIAGGTTGLQLTRARDGGRAGRLDARERRELLDGATGLQLPLGVDRHDLVQDVREVDAVLGRDVPEALRFVDNVRTVVGTTASRLDDWLDTTVGASSEPDAVTFAIPPAVLAAGEEDVEYVVDQGSTSEWSPPELHLSDLLRDASRRPVGQRVRRLRSLPVEARLDGRRVVRDRAIRWIEATTVLDDRRYHLVDGDWVEIDPQYERTVRDEVRRAFTAGAGLQLPPWPWSAAKGGPVDEKVYNATAGAPWLCLDARLARKGIHAATGLEICDLLGPGGVHVHVKRAKDGASLSHLFAQGANSVEALQNQAEVRRGFRELVVDALRGRDAEPYLSEDLIPRRLVFAVLKGSRRLTADTLPPMAAVTLAQKLRALRASPMTAVEVVPIALDRG